MWVQPYHFLSMNCYSIMLRVYNTLARKKEPFVPKEAGKVAMYVCGMTTYSDAHIGHARTYVAFDVIRRYLEYRGYRVRYVQNITDIDDKIIAAAQREGKDALEYSAHYAKRCQEDMEKLGIRPADFYPKASENIDGMIETIKKLVERGYAYAADGDVYFSLEKFADYGKLSGQKLEQVKAGARIEPGEKKRKPEDFALWKAAKPGEPKWQSPWGEGRPGWHIECSSMSERYLGIPFDIHGGGRDLVFPHHENEIAQAEAAYGKRFVNYWLHSGMLKVNGEKMSKSLGNIINVRDALSSWDAETLRFFFISYHYRSPADFSENTITNAGNALARLREMKHRLGEAAGDDGNVSPDELDERERKYLEDVGQFTLDFEEAMNDDFNTPRALEVMFDFVKTTNKFLMEKDEPNRSLCRHALNEFMKIADVLTLTLETDEKGQINGQAIKTLAEQHGVTGDTPEELIEGLLMLRQSARKEKNYELADRIREELAHAGIVIEDMGEETKWRVA